ncbi:MAG: hypothetical protein JOY96_09385 [Verrucomicrobia bacterium]|nr:hypothetical protein [Verrucomicrobiota bacterium]
MDSPSATLEQFCRLPPAWPRIGLLVTAMFAVVILAAQGNVEPLPSWGIHYNRPTRQTWERLTFLAYAALFLSMWLVYFLSRSKAAFFNVRTLRKLLQLTSQLWLPSIHSAEKKEFEQIFIDKARTSITVLGILTAAAGLELVQVNAILLSVSGQKAMADPWNVVMLAGATLAAIAAFVYFLISADSLDCLFNRFDPADDERLKRNFYRRTITPRYLGVVMLMVGAVLLVAFHEPTLASMAMGVLIVVGYRHWFPSFPDVSVQVQCGTLSGFFRRIERGASIGAYLLLLAGPLLTFCLNDMPVPTHLFAVLAAALWAFSAPVINRGLNRLPKEGRLYGILCGLLVSLICGSATLSLLTLGSLGRSAPSLYMVLRIVFTFLPFAGFVYLVLAGVFTFPLATGLYYGCAHAFGERAEFAAQFVKVKPILSVLLATFLLHESFRLSSAISLVLIIIGVALLLGVNQQCKPSLYAVGLGVLTALSWSLGEIFFKLGHHTETILDDTLLALISGTLLGLIGMLLSTAFIVKRTDRRAVYKAFPNWVIYFVLHGILSFGLAYACLFRSIAAVGVSRTVMITSFWPIASLITSANFVFEAKPRSISGHVVWAAAALLAGSLLQLLT